ncbi:MAG: protein-glutamate O-methyltransferase CheR, partial [Desulfamplus sp.]|nr:protein-glutamate O-methyltransferase CheR [Desulfamplus sp.]
MRYGYDFTNYAYASMKRRLKKTLEESSMKRFSDM